MEELIPWVLTGIVAIVTALAGAVTHLWRQNGKFLKDQISTREKRIKELEEKERRSEEKIERLEDRVTQLELERTQLESRFMVFQSSHESNPFPAWFKDVDGRVLACNKAYETVFLRPRGYSLEDYIGKRDSNVWPDHVAEAFDENDKQVLADQANLDTMEVIVNKHGTAVPVRVVKYPRMLLGVSTPIGVAGIAILPDLTGEEFNH